MRFPDHFLEEVKSRVVLSDVMGRRHKVVRSGRSLKVCCPFHNEKSPSCYVYDADGHYHCFGCGAHGDVIEYLMRQDGYSFYDAVVTLAKDYGLTLPTPEKQSPEAEKEQSRREHLYGLMEDVTQWYEKHLRSAEGKGALAYLQQRSFNRETLARFRIGFSPAGSSLVREFHKTRGVPLKDLADVGLVITDSDRGEPFDRFRGRLMFPILNKKGHIIGFGGRQLGEGRGPKYLNSPETLLFHKGAELYGHAFAARPENRDQPLVVCEGYTDVMSLHQAGFTRAVAPLGTALTATQISLLWRLSKKPILCFDGDGAGARAAERAAETALPLVTPDKTLLFLSLPEGEDPASLLEKGGRDRFQRLLEGSCKPLVTLLWRACLPASPPQTPEEQAKIKKQMATYTGQIQDQDLRESYYGMLQDFYRQYLQSQRAAKPAYGPGPGAQSTGAYRSLAPSAPAFGWGASGWNANAGRGGWSGGRNPWGAGPRGAGAFRAPFVERPEMDTAYMREAILMHALLNFPVFLQDYEEEIVHFSSGNLYFEKLKESLLDLLNETPDLDKDTLKAHLYERGFEKMVAQLEDPRVAVHASFARADRDIEDVRPLFQAYLRSAWAEKGALEDMKQQTEAFASQMSRDEWEKIQHRRASIASTLREGQDPRDE